MPSATEAFVNHAATPEGDTNVVHFRPLRRRYQMRTHSGIQLNVTSMVDMALLLLKFFIITTTFSRLEATLSARMPNESAALATPLPIQPVLITLAPAGPSDDLCTIRIETVSQTASDFEHLHGLLVQLQQRVGFDAETPVIVRGDADVAWDHVVNAWNAAYRAGYKKVAVAE